MNVQNQWGHTPLMEAVCYNNKDASQRILSAGCDVNLREYKSGDTALHVAVRKNYTTIVDQVRAEVQFIVFFYILSVVQKLFNLIDLYISYSSLLIIRFNFSF